MVGSDDSAAWDLRPAVEPQAVAAIALKVFLTRDTAPGGGSRKSVLEGTCCPLQHPLSPSRSVNTSTTTGVLAR